MEETVTASDLAALNHKIDVLAAQLDYLTEQAQTAARRQQERAELVQDVLPIANDAVELITEQLEEVKEYVDLCDILRLMKRLLRSGRNLDTMLDRLESLMDLGQTVGPLTDQAFEKMTDALQKADERGYFEVARRGGRMVDNVVGSLAREEESRPVDASYRSLLRQMRDPDVRRGMALTLRVLGAVGAEVPSKPSD